MQEGGGVKGEKTLYKEYRRPWEKQGSSDLQ